MFCELYYNNIIIIIRHCLQIINYADDICWWDQGSPKGRGFQGRFPGWEFENPGFRLRSGLQVDKNPSGLLPRKKPGWFPGWISNSGRVPGSQLNFSPGRKTQIARLVAEPWIRPFKKDWKFYLMQSSTDWLSKSSKSWNILIVPWIIVKEGIVRRFRALRPVGLR